MVGSLDNISEDALDTLALLYKNRQGFTVSDDRKEKMNGKNRKRFLIRREFRDLDVSDSLPDFTFIWINNNLWQYNYLNVNCNHKGKWEDPLVLLNKLLIDDRN